MPDELFIETSVIVAILKREDDWADLALSIERARSRFTSPVAVVEATIALSSIFAVRPSEAEQLIGEFLRSADIDMVEVGARTAALAVAAFERYGKGRGHPARLNIGDCFSYASAREHGLTLLYKGADFVLTDLG